MTVENTLAPGRRRRFVRRPIARALAAACVAVALLAPVAAPSAALAQSGKVEEESETDARLEGYGQIVNIEKSGTALTWGLFFLLALIGLGVLFKNAKRSHLD